MISLKNYFRKPSVQIVFAMTVTLLAIGFATMWPSAPRMTSKRTQAPTAHFLGSQTCTQCHQAEYHAWTGSHHELAMQPASDSSVLAPFHGEQFSEDGITSVFVRRNGHFYVTTEGKNGKMHEFEVAYTFGLAPLQQYLIPMPDGAMQALTIAWDSRPRQQGGQRWFALQAGLHIHAGNEMHWTGRQNNWNFMCAECHMTQFKKNYDAQTRTYSSSWSALNVGCEACHGPGSNHVSWAGLSNSLRQEDGNKGLMSLFNERNGVKWSIQPDSGNAKSEQTPLSMRKEVEMCARCHSRRSQISDDYHAEQSLLNTHLPALLENSLFWNDGQMKEEVYNHASFEQSKMYRKGVTCSDCHDPHSQRLRLPGNQTCLQCHLSTKYDSTSHHFHTASSPGASCAACHMPTTTYMSIDPRHDHSIRVPRPDLSLSNGIPNACNKCHTDKTVQWAADAALRWYPQLTRRAPELAAVLMSGQKLDRDAITMLNNVMADPKQSSIVRATALSRIPTGVSTERTVAMLLDKDPLLRMTAIEACSGMPEEFRAVWLRPLLSDPVKGVRISAARWLAGVFTADWNESDKNSLVAAEKEYVAVQYFNADRPEAYNNLATFYADQQDWGNAESASKIAIEMDPSGAVSRLNLADIYRSQGKEKNAQKVLQQVIRTDPKNALAQHALGLSLIRQKHTAQALTYLHEATQLEPDNTHFAFVYTLALGSNGNHVRAIAEWERAIKDHPADQELLSICRRKEWNQVPQCVAVAGRL